MSNNIAKILGALIVDFIGAFFIMYFWNSIANTFSLPEFGYWVAFSAVMSMEMLAHIFKPTAKKDEVKSGT